MAILLLQVLVVVLEPVQWRPSRDAYRPIAGEANDFDPAVGHIALSLSGDLKEGFRGA